MLSKGQCTSSQDTDLQTTSNKTDVKKPILLVNIGQLVTLQAGPPGPRRGKDLRELGIIEDAAVVCLGGKIVAAGKTRDAVRDSWVKRNRKKLVEIDCAGKVVLPGFVDSHTHPAFISPRLIDFDKRISGSSYEEIAAAGGGIRSSVDAVRRAGKRQLADHILNALTELSTYGTTTVEAKSGYGLSLDAESKSLEAIRTASGEWPGTVIPTLLGAHVVPCEYIDRPQEYVTLVCEQMIPLVARRKLAKFVDVFCDRGAFSKDDTLKIATAARSNNLQIRVHISQLTRTPLDRLLRLGPMSVDHLDHVNEADVARLANSATIATLVPGVNYFLDLDEYPPARRLIEAGAAVALATDYNPGSSPTSSMPFVLSLACTHMKMTPEEAISAATINGAFALALADRKGSVEPGKDADLGVFDVNDYREIAYWVPANRCSCTILNGELQQNGQTN
jgi:imidazolonepropionase